MRKQSSLFLIPVLCGVTQSKVTSRSYNVLKTTQLELALAILITSISEVLSYYVNSIGHQLSKGVIILHQKWFSKLEQFEQFICIKTSTGLTEALAL